jgi:pimeloyl-ACP methyl ester carboxylesterase
VVVPIDLRHQPIVVMKLAQKLGLAYYRANLQLLSLVSPKKAAKRAFQIFSTPLTRARPDAVPIFDEAELLSFKLGDALIYGNRWNHPAKRKALIVHGFESNSTKFHQYISGLVKLDFEVLAFDAPAHGGSGGKRILLPDYMDMIRAVIDKYGPIENYIAHSFGGLSLMLTLETIPGDKGWKVALVAPATETTSAIDRFFRIFKMGEKVRLHFEELVVKKGSLPSSWYSIRRAIQKTEASILWIHDSTDKVTPIEDALKVKDDNHSHVEFVTTNGLGHRRIYKDQIVIEQVISFLNR